MSEPWSVLTAAEVVAEFTPQETAVLKNIQQAVDRLPDIVSRVIEAVRDAYRSGGRLLGDAGTIPDGLKSKAVSIARWRLLIAFPQLQKLQTKERQQAHDEAEKYLESIARREIKGAGSAEIVSQQTRRANRTTMNGL